MHNNDTLPKKVEYGNIKSYAVGFILSIFLTLAAYLIVVQNLLTGFASDCAVTALGLVQALVQLLLFLNLNREPRPRWNLVVFLFMLMVVIILVVGSIWIMDNLQYNLM